MSKVQFTEMKYGSKEDYELLSKFEKEYAEKLPDRILEALLNLGDSMEGYQVSRLEHSLQSATRAERDGADEETIVCALLHDIGDVLSPDNHSQVVAAILQPFISERNYWVLKHHGLFQGYYYFHHINKDRNIREKFKDHQFYQACVDFCFQWDQCSFDPNYENLPLENFEPMVRRVMKEPWTRFD